MLAYRTLRDSSCGVLEKSTSAVLNDAALPELEPLFLSRLTHNPM